MSEENRGTHKLYEKDRIGEVQIADEVVAIIAGLAATEVEGVDSMAGNITNELVGKLGMKNLSKGVKVDVTENHVSVDLSLNIRYGFNIPSVSEQVQEKVSAAIERACTIDKDWVRISIFCRSKRSTKTLMRGVTNKIGIWAIKVTVASKNTEPVRRYTSQLIAICCIQVPVSDTHIPVKYNRKLRVFNDIRIDEKALPLSGKISRNPRITFFFF